MLETHHSHEISLSEDDASPDTGELDISAAPNDPGCYLMYDRDDRVLYVGKAKNLRARLRNYINATDSRYSVKFLMRRAARVECLVVGTEKEALLLENSLIKRYKPRYNVRLRDDKNFISIRLHPGEAFPRMTVVRRRAHDGARYFGPYHDARAARKTMKHMQKIMPLRVCSDSVLENRSRPCIYHQIKQCLAPCVGLVSSEAYQDVVRQALLALEGRGAELEKQLREEITKLAAALRFEEAAVVRDRLYDLQATLEPQRAVTARSAADRDVFGLYMEGRFIEIQALYYRNNAMIGGDAFSFERIDAPPEEMLASFLLQYYDIAPVIPQEILLPLELEDREALAELLGEKRGGGVVLRCPKRGELTRLIELANNNAQHAFQEKRGRDKARRDALEQVRQTLSLPRTPERIECFDVSTIQGDKTVASMAVFEGGEPCKRRYRRYSIRSIDAQDDFAAMRETLLRRFSRAIQEKDLPDLVLIDGGKGHLNVAVDVFRQLGLTSLPCASIAKARAMDGASSPERFFIPGRMNPIVPRQNSPVVHLLSRIRDEAHRFAISFHRQKRAKAALSSALRDIPGVGEQRAKALLRTFGSASGVRKASLEELAAAPGIGDTLARTILDALHRDNQGTVELGPVETKEEGI